MGSSTDTTQYPNLIYWLLILYVVGIALIIIGIMVFGLQNPPSKKIYYVSSPGPSPPPMMMPKPVPVYTMPQPAGPASLSLMP